jgi:hypothetical protein
MVYDGLPINSMVDLSIVIDLYPLVMTNIAIENGHRNSGFSH